MRMLVSDRARDSQKLAPMDAGVMFPREKRGSPGAFKIHRCRADV